MVDPDDRRTERQETRPDSDDTERSTIVSESPGVPIVQLLREIGIVLATLVPITILVWMVPPHHVLEPEFAGEERFVLLLLTGLYLAFSRRICLSRGYSDLKVLGIVVGVPWIVVAVSAYLFYLKAQAHVFPREAEKLGQDLQNVPYAISYFILLVSGTIRKIIEPIDANDLLQAAAIFSLIGGLAWSLRRNKKWINPVSAALFIFFLACHEFFTGESSCVIQTVFLGVALLLVLQLGFRFTRKHLQQFTIKGTRQPDLWRKG